MPADERLPMPNRRRLLGWGAAAAAAVPGGAGAALPHDDAELLAIGRRLDVLFPAAIANWDVLDECETRARSLRGDRPDALRKRPFGVEVNGWGNSGAFGGSTFYDDEDAARAARNLPGLDLKAAEGSRAASAAAARAREIIAAHEAWESQKDAANLASGLDAANDQAVDLSCEIAALHAEAMLLRATTLAGMHVKARLAHWYGPWDGADEFDDHERRALNSLLADLAAATRLLAPA